MIRKVVLVFKTHFDLGFTDMAETVLSQYSGKMLDDVLCACEDTRQMGELSLVWTVPAMPLCEMLSRAAGDKLERLTELVRAGRITWHALPFTSHFDFCGIEDYIEGMRYSRELAARFGVSPPVSAKMTDVPGHGRMLPQLLTGAGVKFLHLGSNEFPFTPEVPDLFFWEAPDGSRLLTMYSAGGYGSPIIPPQGWELPVWIAFLHTHDNAGPPKTEDIRKMVAEVKKAHPGAEVMSGSLDDFYKEIAKLDLSHLPTVKEDLADSWIHGVGAYPKEVSSVRDSRRKALLLNTAAALSAPVAGIAQKIQAARRNLSIFGEHTWGLDVKTWLPADERVYPKEEFLQALKSPTYQTMEASWQEQRQRAINASDILSECEMLLSNRSETCNVLNPGGTSFTGWARMPGSVGQLDFFGTSYTYVENLPAISVSSISPFDITKQVLKQSKVDHEITLENHRYSIKFSEASGSVLEVFDKELAAPILKADSDVGVFSYLYHLYGDNDLNRYLEAYCNIPSDWGFQDNGRENYPPTKGGHYSPEFVSWEVIGHTLKLLYKGTQAKDYGDSKQIEIHITLPPLGDELFAEIRLTTKQPTPYIEAGSFVLPFAGQSPKFYLNKNGGLVNPSKDIARCANHALYCLESFVAVEDRKAGVCIVAADTPLMGIGESGVLTFRKDYEPHSPNIHFNLFNNSWGTNFPQWMSGNFCYRFTIFGYKPEQSVYGRALQLGQGAVGVFKPPAPSLLKLPLQVETTEFSRTGNNYTLRLRDTSGLTRQVEIGLTVPGVLWETNLMGDVLGSECRDSLITKLSGYGLISLEFKLDHGIASSHETTCEP